MFMIAFVASLQQTIIQNEYSYFYLNLLHFFYCFTLGCNYSSFYLATTRAFLHVTVHLWCPRKMGELARKHLECYYLSILCNEKHLVYRWSYKMGNDGSDWGKGSRLCLYSVCRMEGWQSEAELSQDTQICVLQMYSEGHSPAALQQPSSFKFNNNSFMQNMRQLEATIVGWRKEGASSLCAWVAFNSKQHGSQL